MYNPRVFRNSNNIFTGRNSISRSANNRRFNSFRTRFVMPSSINTRNRNRRANRALVQDIRSVQQLTNAYPPIAMNNGFRPFNINNPRRGRRRSNNSTRDRVVQMKVPQGFCVNQSEFLGKIRKGMNVFNIHPGNIQEGTPLLNIMAMIFDNCILEQGIIMLRSSVATSKSGTVYAGIDYSGNTPDTLEGVAALDHSQTFTIYGNGNIVINVNAAMKAKQHYCYRPGQTSEVNGPFCKICVYVDTNEELEDVGTLSFSYRVKFLNIDPSTLNKISSAAVNQGTVIANQLPVESNPSPEPAHVTAQNPTERDPAVTVINAKDNIAVEGVDGTVSSFNIGRPEVGKILSTVTTPQTDLDGYLSATPKITFRYADGSTIDPGTFVPVDAPMLNGVKVAAYHVHTFQERQQFTDILGTIWKIVKPLAKPVVDAVCDIAHEAVSDQNLRLKLQQDEDAPYNMNLDVVAYGSKVEVDVPTTEPLSMRDFNMLTHQIMYRIEADTVSNLSMFLPDAQYLINNLLGKQSYVVYDGTNYHDLLPGKQLSLTLSGVLKVLLYVQYELKDCVPGDFFVYSAIGTSGDIRTSAPSVEVWNYLPVKDDRESAQDNWEIISSTEASAFPAYLALKPGFDSYRVCFKVDISQTLTNQDQKRISPTLIKVNSPNRKDVAIPMVHSQSSRTRFLS